jgi:hypothetical protein
LLKTHEQTPDIDGDEEGKGKNKTQATHLENQVDGEFSLEYGNTGHRGFH